MGAALFKFPDPATVLAAAKIVGNADDEHDATDQSKEVRKGEEEREVLKDIGRHKVCRNVHQCGETADNETDHHFQAAVRILPCQVHDFDRDLSVLALDCVLL